MCVCVGNCAREGTKMYSREVRAKPVRVRKCECVLVWLPSWKHVHTYLDILYIHTYIHMYIHIINNNGAQRYMYMHVHCYRYKPVNFFRFVPPKETVEAMDAIDKIDWARFIKPSVSSISFGGEGDFFFC